MRYDHLFIQNANFMDSFRRLLPEPNALGTLYFYRQDAPTGALFLRLSWSLNNTLH
jgi:hypothetical protein